LTIDCACLPTLRYVALVLLFGASACAGGGPIGSQAWLPPPEDDDAGAGSSSEDAGDTGETAVCEAGTEVACACAGGDAGVRTCFGDAWGECECGDAESSDGGADTAAPGTATEGDATGSDTDGGEPMPANEACFPGAANDWTTCLPLHAFAADEMPDGYAYPEALDGDANYRKPVAFVDLQEVDGATQLAPNFLLSELAQIEKGRWAIVQPHAIASLQELRDSVGAIGVNSAFRSPSYNVQIGGATWSRHMYGDGYDLDPIDTGLTTLESECTTIGGFLVEYDTHVHCDFRDDAVDEGFFGAAADAPSEPTFVFEAEVIEYGDGVFTATATGFDEGEPKRRWIAKDANGDVIARATGAVFVAPDDATAIEVVVGSVVTASRERP
jgi:hypothetical protein